MPKFGHKSDSQIFMRPINEHQINSYDRSFLLNRNPTNYSTIEKQNREEKNYWNKEERNIKIFQKKSKKKWIMKN